MRQSPSLKSSNESVRSRSSATAKRLLTNYEITDEMLYKLLEDRNWNRFARYCEKYQKLVKEGRLRMRAASDSDEMFRYAVEKQAPARVLQAIRGLQNLTDEKDKIDHRAFSESTLDDFRGFYDCRIDDHGTPEQVDSFSSSGDNADQLLSQLETARSEIVGLKVQCAALLRRAHVAESNSTILQELLSKEKSAHAHIMEHLANAEQMVKQQLQVMEGKGDVSYDVKIANNEEIESLKALHAQELEDLRAQLVAENESTIAEYEIELRQQKQLAEEILMSEINRIRNGYKEKLSKRSHEAGSEISLQDPAPNYVEDMKGDCDLASIECRISSGKDKEQPSLLDETDSETEPSKVEFDVIAKQEDLAGTECIRRNLVTFVEASFHSLDIDSSDSTPVGKSDDHCVQENHDVNEKERRTLFQREDTYRGIPLFTWRRESFTLNGNRKVNYKPVEDDGSNEHDIQFADLRKQRMLGEGMFGQVWLVSGKSRPYALKIQSKFELAEGAKIEVAVREKQIMSKLRHPFVIRLIKAYQDKHFIYLIMDFVKGGELWSLMHPSTETIVESVCLPESQAKFYALCLSDALSYIHRSGVSYRDMKPENVLIDAAGYPVLVDFGFAKRLEHGEKTYTMVGTPAYCSPEILSGEGHDMRSDNWSLGILTYEMLEGANPFSYEGIDSSSLYHAILEEDFTPPDGVSVEAIDFVCKLLVKDPSQRLGINSTKDLLDHEWFDGLNIGAMRRRQTKVPWIPTISEPFDSSHFEDFSEVEDKSVQKYPKIRLKEEALFESFTFTTESMQ